MSGIPTIGVRGIQFRSRIEAQWAYIFENFGWNWDYEPIDLDGYIPDFIIIFNDEKILIEIKGDTNIWKNYKEHEEKIKKSGWKKKFAILGSVYKICENFNDDCPNVGKVFYIRCDNNEWVNDDIIIRKEKRNLWNFGGDLYVYDICGGYWKDTIETKKDFSTLWVKAKNSVQWKGIQNLNVIKDKILEIEKDVENNIQNKGYVSNYDGKYIKPIKDCEVCNGSGISYWTDGVFSSCMECCFLCNDKKRLYKK